MDTKRGTIIIVDDDSTNLAVGKSALYHKYDVFTIAAGEKLFAILDRVTPDLILLDIRMPGMDGYEVIRRLKSSPQTADIPVIFLTSSIDYESQTKGFDYGAVDYITKPFSREILIESVERHILRKEGRTTEE